MDDEAKLEDQIEQEVSAMQKLIGKLQAATDQLDEIEADVDNAGDVKP